jgi:hypothetical protein
MPVLFSEIKLRRVPTNTNTKDTRHTPQRHRHNNYYYQRLPPIEFRGPEGSGRVGSVVQAHAHTRHDRTGAWAHTGADTTQS